MKKSILTPLLCDGSYVRHQVSMYTYLFLDFLFDYMNLFIYSFVRTTLSYISVILIKFDICEENSSHLALLQKHLGYSRVSSLWRTWIFLLDTLLYTLCSLLLSYCYSTFNYIFSGIIAGVRSKMDFHKLVFIKLVKLYFS